ncbi:hypothetical protein VNO80_20449 [Phaseolus coccineus]|uniref:Uncharacterized protein n=1 Tax=Phaseolus coccineus TaxID=3886 RepID=A0AAN9MHB9_PHACN
MLATWAEGFVLLGTCNSEGFIMAMPPLLNCLSFSCRLWVHILSPCRCILKEQLGYLMIKTICKKQKKTAMFEQNSVSY